MSWMRTKSPDQIRESALSMARRKRDAGCSTCAQAYLDLARVHGASDEELAAITASDLDAAP